MERLATTPFGGARMRADIFTLQQQVAARHGHAKGQVPRREGAASQPMQPVTTDKWQLLRALTHARAAYGLSDRAIVVLEALASFHPDKQLNGTKPIIVFPSNAELSMRARGMSSATLRRHLAVLVNAGLILRRDSANGKRYCQRDRDGVIETAFGFDLSPFALAAEAIQAHANQAIAEAKAYQRLRSEITLHLRDISKMIALALEEGRGGDWQGLGERLASLSGRVSRTVEASVLMERRDNLVRLRAEVEASYLRDIDQQTRSAVTTEEAVKVSGNACNFERHIENTESESQFKNTGKRDCERSQTITLGSFLKLCPEIQTYAKGGITTWRDVIATAGVVRAMLGISSDAYAHAVHAMGPVPTAIVLAVILERADTIQSPGGYLRGITQKARAGAFSLVDVLTTMHRKVHHDTPAGFKATDHATVWS